MRSINRLRKVRILYVLAIAACCYFLSGLPFSYSYFEGNSLGYGYNKKLCQLVKNNRLPLLQNIQSVAIDFDRYINRQNPRPTLQLEEECPD